MVELMACLSDLREFAVQGEIKTGARKEVGGCESSQVSAAQAELLFLRAVSAVSIHRKSALTMQQNTPDPGQQWLEEQGKLMESAVQ